MGIFLTVKSQQTEDIEAQIEEFQAHKGSMYTYTDRWETYNEPKYANQLEQDFPSDMLEHFEIVREWKSEGTRSFDDIMTHISDTIDFPNKMEERRALLSAVKFAPIETIVALLKDDSATNRALVDELVRELMQNGASDDYISYYFSWDNGDTGDFLDANPPEGSLKEFSKQTFLEHYGHTGKRWSFGTNVVEYMRKHLIYGDESWLSVVVPEEDTMEVGRTLNVNVGERSYKCRITVVKGDGIYDIEWINADYVNVEHREQIIDIELNNFWVNEIMEDNDLPVSIRICKEYILEFLKLDEVDEFHMKKLTEWGLVPADGKRRRLYCSDRAALRRLERLLDLIQKNEN